MLLKDHFGYKAHARAIHRERIACQKQVYGYSWTEASDIAKAMLAVDIACSIAAMVARYFGAKVQADADEVMKAGGRLMSALAAKHSEYIIPKSLRK